MWEMLQPVAAGWWRHPTRNAKILLELRSYAASSCDVQFGRRVALIGMLEQQKEQSLVVGAAGGSSSFRFSRFIALTTRKIAKAMIMKSITVLMKSPMFQAGAV